MKKTVLLFFAVLLFLAIGGCSLVDSGGTVQSNPCLQKNWPQQESELLPDPALTFGRLENGLRYVIMKNQEPRDRVGMYLYVQAGSLYETEWQRGLAHFLEHMLFEGSTHFPPGTLVDYFQSIGMSFGADTNAHTGYDETVYNILLPNGKPETLDQGLLVLADYAGGALLLDTEIDQEKGVILAEKRSRDSASFRLREKRFSFLFKGTQVAVRAPIGLEDTINKADHALLNRYYRDWYRPENMVVVVVGDMETTITKELIQKQFHSLISATPGKCPDLGKVVHSGTEYFYHQDPEAGSTEVTVESVWNTDPEPDSLEFEKRQLVEYAAASIMEHRLERLVNQPDSPLTDSTVYSGIFLQRTGYAAVTAETDPGRWKEGLTMLNTALRQALEYGFSDNEVERMKKELLSSLDDEVEKAATRDSRKLAKQIIDSLSDNRVFLSPEEEKKLYTPVVNGFSVESVNTAFQGLWSHKNRLVQVTGNVKIDQDGKKAHQKIDEVFSFSEHAEIKPLPDRIKPVFPYLPTPEKAGTISKLENLKDISVFRFTLENGTIINVKSTDFKENEVAITVNLGNGSLGEPLPGLGTLAQAVVRESGLGKLTRDELEEALTGHDVKLFFKTGVESFTFTGNALRKDLELMFRLIRTSLVDPAFRVDAYSRSMKRFHQMYIQMESTIDGAMALTGERFLAGNNSRYGQPPWSEFSQYSLDQVKNWLSPVFASAPLEVSVVGDCNVNKVIQLAALYLGSRPSKKRAVLHGETIAFPAGKSKELKVKTVIDKAQVVVAWPTDDFWDISRTRRLHVLASVLDDRLRKAIREKLGAVYSPVVYNHADRVDPGYGVLRAVLTVDPKKAEMIIDEVQKVVAELAANGVTSEELQRTVGPTLTSIKDFTRSNGYWLHSVLELSSRHPDQLKWPLSIKQDFSAISVEDISNYAAKYLKENMAAIITILPEDSK